MTSDWHVFDGEEYRALRREIELRILLQNLSLMLLALLFSGIVSLQALRPEIRYQLATGFSISAGMLSLFWIHSGARTLQIKTYLRHVVEPRGGCRARWETWHDVNRVQGVLGSRWFISTKGVFVGSQLAALSYAWLGGQPAGPGIPYAVLTVLGVAATALFLRRPRLAPEAYGPVGAGSRQAPPAPSRPSLPRGPSA